MVKKCCQKGSSAGKKLIALKENLEILSDENRLRILCLLKECDELCVCDIYKALDLPQNLVSYHLGKLKEAGFLQSRKDGVRVMYKRGDKHANAFHNLISLII